MKRFQKGAISKICIFKIDVVLKMMRFQKIMPFLKICDFKNDAISKIVQFQK